MSVLKSKRSISSAEFINTASTICEEVDAFLLRLSARTGRLYREPISRLAHELLAHAEWANSIYPQKHDEVRNNLRKHHLLEARGALLALDVEMTRCYRVLYENPQGAFTNKSGKPISPGDAKEKLDKMAQSLGEKIDVENGLLTGALKKLNEINREAKKERPTE